MNPDRLLNTPCTVWRVTEGAPDGHGVAATTRTSSTSKCWVDLRGRTTESSESGPPTNFGVETVDLYLLPDQTISTADQVEVGADLYDVLGPPHTFTDPRTGAEVYTLAVGRKVT